jgi:hypothetical protein
MGFWIRKGGRLVGLTHGADVAVLFAASFADPNSPAPYKLTASASFTDRLGAYPNLQNTYPFGHK